jgi:hypothetical protein
MSSDNLILISSKVWSNLRLLLRKLSISPLRMLIRSCNASDKASETPKANRNSLPIEILVLQQYLSVKDISRLDIAICDVDLRLLFLSSLQSMKIRDYNISGRRDDFVTEVIKRQIKLLNLKVHSGDFTKISVDKMAAGKMKLDTIEELQWNSTFRCGVLLESPITSAALSKIAIHCPMLRILDLNSSLKNAAEIRGAECCPMLQNLNLSRCNTLTDIAMIKIAECCSVLKHLELKCSSITDIAIIRITECYPLLKLLFLECLAITDIAIIKIAE